MGIEGREAELAPFPTFGWRDLIVSNRKVLVNQQVDENKDISSALQMHKIRSMIDTQQYNYIRYFMSNLRKRVYEEKFQKQMYDVLLSPVSSIPVPPSFPEELTLKLWYLNNSLTIKCASSSPIRIAIVKALDVLNRRKLLENSGIMSANDIILKAFGRRLFLTDLSTPLNKLSWVREQVKTRNLNIVMCMLKRADVLGPLSLTEVC